MRYRPLGKTGFSVSEIGLGCASYWGKASFDEAEAIRVVHAALDHGVTYFDTGSSYSKSNAEPRLGRALATHSGKDKLVISTKAGTKLGSFGRLSKDFSPAWIKSSVEASLRNLKLDALPLLLLHGPQIENLTDELLVTLEQLRQQGKVRHFGANSFDPPIIEYLSQLPVFSVAMIDYNILRPERQPLIEKLATRNFGILAGMALAGGLYRRNLHQPRALRDIWYLLRAYKNHRGDIARAASFRFLKKMDADTAGKIALAWVLDNSHISSAVLGTTRVSHIVTNVAASGYTLDDAMRSAIRTAQRQMQT